MNKKTQGKLTRKERKAVENAEKARIAEERRATELHYRIIQSTQDILPVKDILNGVVITKDGRYVKLLEFKPVNFMYMEPESQERLISTFASMLQAVSVNIQFKAISKKADVESMISTVKEIHDKETDERRQKMLEAYIELLRKTALGVGISRRFFIILEFQKTIGNDGTDFDMVCADLNSVAARVKSYMEQAGNIFLPACETDDGLHAAFYQILCRHKSETVPFSEHIEEILNGYMRESPDELPSINATEFFAPAWIDFTHHKHVVVDDKFYTFAYIPSYGYSQRVYAGWMSLFINASEGVDVDIFLTKIPKENIYSKIGMQVKLKRASASESHDTDSDYHQRLDTISSGEYMMLGLSGGEDFYYLSTLLTVVADSLDELEYKYRELEKRVKGQGMMIRRATFMMEECFASMVPVCTLHKDVERKARRNVLTSGASSCYPFISYEMQDPEGIMVGTNKHNNSLVSIDMFDTTAHPNANAVIIGATGSGKTFTAQLFALRLSLMNVQTFVIAPLKGREDYMGGCNAVGGQFVSMDPSAYNNINIMDIRVPDDEDLMRMEGYTDRGALLTKKIHTIKTFLGLVVRDLTQEEEQLLDTCLYSLYGRFGITTDNDSLFDAVTHEYKKMPLLGDLYEEMAGVEELHRVRNILSPLINGSLAAYNRPTNIDLDSKYIVFDFNGLKGDLLVLSMFIVLDFVWSKIKEDRTKRKAVFIDECWKLIGTDSNRRAAEDVVEIFRTIRAYGGSAFAMTQDVSQFFEFENGKYGKAVIGNADTKIVMHLQPNEAYMLQEAVQLTDAEIDNIIKLQTGHGFVASSGGKLFVEFLASPYEKYAITTDANEMYRRGQAIRTAKEKNG